jgi:aspartyl aminopeptidase
MHSSYETGGALDPEYLVRAMGAYFSAGVRRQEDGGYML